MTIEEEFFKVFEIKTQEKSYCSKGYCIRKPSAIKFSDNEICRNCQKGHFYIVPEITDRILLELICIIIRDKTNYSLHLSTIKNIEDLKKCVLKNCIEINNCIKHQVQSLLKGVENE